MGISSVSVWWSKQETALKRFDNLSIVQISDDSLAALTALAGSSMSLQCVIDDGQVVFSSANHDTLVDLDLQILKS